ncbi:hypothetical protein L7F22_020047 [Adiantum nelumboides]|nr:hypothetical protein [Adiantum nelumboides]
METFAIEYGIGYQGTVLHVREDDTALAICGNTIASYSLKGGLNKPLIWGPRFGISVSVFDSSNNWIAYAEKGLHPSVFAYECGKQQLHTKIAGIAEVEVSALAFSKDGFRLLTVSCEPDFKLCLWDLQNREPSKLAEGSSEWLVEFASFNPDSSQQFCISGSGNISVWTYEQNFHRTSFSCKDLSARPYEPHCHAWSEDGQRVYIGCLKGEVLVFDLARVPTLEAVEDDKSERSFQLIDGNLKTLFSGNPSSSESRGGDGWQVLKVSQTMEKVSTICIGELHVVIAEAGGRVCWLSLPSAKSKGNANEGKLDTNADGADLEGCTTESDSTAEGDTDNSIDDGKTLPKATGQCSVDFRTAETCTKAASTVVYSVNLDILEVTNMMYNTDQTQLIVGAASGCIVVIKINKDLLVSTLSGQSGAAVTENFAVIQWRSAYHYGTIHGFATLGDGKFVLSSGHDGTVRVWEADRGKELSRHCFKSAQLCIDSHEETWTWNKARAVMCLAIGEALHSDARRMNFGSNAILGNNLLRMYGKCGCLTRGENVFTGMLEQNVVSWTLLLDAYVELGEEEATLQLYATRKDCFVNITLIGMNGSCGRVAEAKNVFAGFVQHNLVAFNVMLSAYVECGKGDLAICLFRIGFCSDSFVECTILSMYKECGSLVDAKNLVSGSVTQNSLCWTELLSLYASNGEDEKALRVVRDYQH